MNKSEWKVARVGAATRESAQALRLVGIVIDGAHGDGVEVAGCDADKCDFIAQRNGEAERSGVDREWYLERLPCRAVQSVVEGLELALVYKELSSRAGNTRVAQRLPDRAVPVRAVESR